MTEHIKILMLEDSPADAEFVTRLLLKANLVFDFVLVTNRKSFLDALNRGDPSVILADNSLPQFNARQALEIVRNRSLYIPFIMVTGTVSEEFAADIIKLGADDYILKDRMERLPSAIRSAIKHKKAEQQNQEAIEEIKRSNERFLTLSKATKDAVWDWNMHSNEVWFNNNFYALLGYRKGNVIPTLRECLRKIHPLDRSKVISMLIKMRNTSIPFMESEFRLQLADGSFRIVQDRNYILKGTDGKAIRVIGVLVDITKQKNLEQELEVLSIVAKETINSVIIFEKETGLASWINQGFTRHTGFSQKDIYGKNALRI